jgi:hypothetical protein
MADSFRKANPTFSGSVETIMGKAMTENDVRNFIAWPLSVICSDGGNGGHPRGYGTFTRVLYEYVIKQPLLKVETAVYKMTGLTAQHLGIQKRGVIAPGYIADLVLLDMDKDKFNYFLNEKFTDYLGEVKLISNPIAYPLELIIAEKYYHNRIMLIGDSAHSVHPIAGQGFNLGLRDIDTMLQLYSKYHNIGLDFGCHQSLNEYQKLRCTDNNSMAIITHGLNKLFSNNILPVSILRKLGLHVVNQIPSLQKFFMNYAMAKKGK